jgi:hypothetical protein
MRLTASAEEPESEEPESAAPAVTDSLPRAFADCLLDSALEPVLDAAVDRGERAAKRKKRGDRATEVTRALLAVTVCDPACGPGGLLTAAAGRIARRVAEAREGAVTPDGLRLALREVVGHCVYGVDASTEAVALARQRLRLAADVPGLPPLFLGHRVRPGNALVGASPELIDGGIPDGAFAAADGDDRDHARALRRANARPVPGQATLFSVAGGYSHSTDALAGTLAAALAGAAAGRLPGQEQAEADDQRQRAEYRKWRDSADFRGKRLVADAWCAAFAWSKTPGAPPAIVNRGLLDLRERAAEGILPATLAEIGRLRDQHQFFHWHLEFPDVFPVLAGQARWHGGFSCVLTAPPRAKIDRHAQATVFRFAVSSGAYPGSAAGLAEPGVSALAADQLFAERALTLLAPHGRAGCAVAPGTAAAPAARHLIAGLMERGTLASLYDFTGTAGRVGLLTLAGDGAGAAEADPEAGRAASFAFRLRDPADLGDDGRSFTLTPADAARLNPNTGGLPPLLGSRDAALVTAVYHHVPALWDETRADGNPWKLRLGAAFPRGGAAAGLLRSEQELRDEGWQRDGSTFTRDGQRMLPLYEPPMAGRYDHRAAPPRYWAAACGPVTGQRDGGTGPHPGVTDHLAELGWKWRWLCAWRVPAGEPTAVALFLPRAATTASLPLMLPRVVPPFAAALIAAQSSLVFDYVARQKTAGTALRTAQWKQLPVPAPGQLEPHLPFIVPRVLELAYTSADLGPLARDLDDDGDAPFAWDDDRRASLRAELDALFFRLYGIGDRADAEYIAGQVQGDERAGKLTLAAYDRMAEADEAGAGYETRLFPPPGHGPRSRRTP